jgi:hypothetical protein
LYIRTQQHLIYHHNCGNSNKIRIRTHDFVNKVQICNRNESTILPVTSEPSSKRRLSAPLWRRLILGNKRLYIPDTLGVLINTSVTREEAHSRDRGNTLAGPLLCVLVALVDELLRLDIRCKVVGHKVVVAVLDNTVEKSREALSIAEHASVDGVEDLRELGLELVLRIEMCVSEVFNILCKVTEEEDVFFADFTGNLNLRRVSCRS